ncbi:MAG TPA: hypothetical protein VNZ25_06170 [Candidatus Angelobacter sp.]|jgi:hypothetical protein|nr:hypothetical protein [Candidatus Angelobacter sp.]
MESMVLEQFAFFNRLSHVVWKWLKSSAKPEHEPEQYEVAGETGDSEGLALVLAFWVKSIRVDGHKRAPAPLAQQDDLFLMEGSTVLTVEDGRLVGVAF